MVLEHAVLTVRAGTAEDFESSFDRARPLISVQPGFRGLTLSRSIETPTRYLLLVEWDSIESHTEGFRASAQYQEWSRLLHHFYDPFPPWSTTPASSEPPSPPASHTSHAIADRGQETGQRARRAARRA